VSAVASSPDQVASFAREYVAQHRVHPDLRNLLTTALSERYGFEEWEASENAAETIEAVQREDEARRTANAQALDAEQRRVTLAVADTKLRLIAQAEEVAPSVRWNGTRLRLALVAELDGMVDGDRPVRERLEVDKAIDAAVRVVLDEHRGEAETGAARPRAWYRLYRRTLDWFMRPDCPLADPLDRLILMVLVDHANGLSGETWPSRRRMAEVVGVHEATIYRHLLALEALGVIHKVRRGGDHRSNRYRLVIP